MKHATSRRRHLKLSALCITLVLAVAACGGGGNTGASTSSDGGSGGGPSASTPRRGGSVVSLLGQAFNGNWPSGIDPATSTTGSAQFSIQQAVFGGLFLLRADDDGTHAKVVPYQAASGTVSADAMTLTVKLRKGLVFSDGTPLNADAVIWNWERDTASACCAPTEWTVRKKDPFTSPDPLTVVMHLAKPYAPILNTFPTENFNWMVSPTAFKKMGEAAFRIKPVGAGPFTVVSDQLSTKIELKRNPKFFKHGQPYLDRLTFETIGGDQPAYQAILAGQADAYELMKAPRVISQAEQNSKVAVTVLPPTQPFTVQMNTAIPPFNNKKAREAIYYASDWDAINKGILDGKYPPVEGIETPYDLFYHKHTPGYRTYDLERAKKLVHEVGGINITSLVSTSYGPRQVMTALQSQWEKAGITARIKAVEIAPLIKDFKGGQWQAALQPMGNWDPGSGTGVYFRFGSTSPFSGVHDKHLDELIQQGKATSDPGKRDTVYQEINKYISDKAYAVFGVAEESAMLAVKGLHAPGLTTEVPGGDGAIWAEAWTENP